MARYDNIVSSATEGTTLVPDIVTAEILATAAEQEIGMQLCRRFDYTGLPGDTFAVNSTPAVTFGALTQDSTTEPGEDAFTLTARTITPVQRQVDVILSSKMVADAAGDISASAIREIGVALGRDRDVSLFSLYTEAPASAPDHEIGTDAVALDFADLTTTLQLLHTQNAPRPYFHVIAPIQASELLGDTVFQSAAIKGEPVLTNGLGSNGFFTKILDLLLYVSPDIVEATGLHSMAFPMGAFGYGFKRMSSPLSPTPQELLVDVEWNSKRRVYELNATYYGDFEGLRNTTTTNKWVVDLIS
jgi:hypothetical protein